MLLLKAPGGGGRRLVNKLPERTSAGLNGRSRRISMRFSGVFASLRQAQWQQTVSGFIDQKLCLSHETEAEQTCPDRGLIQRYSLFPAQVSS